MQEMISEVDTTLCEHANEILFYYMRFSRHFINLKMRQRVAHITGTLPSVKDQFTIRKVLSRIKGIYAIWDIVRISGYEPPVILDLGCGNQKQYSDFIGVDQYRCPAVDILANMEKRLPFQDDSADHVFAIHVLEHIQSLMGLMNEIHRVLKPGGAFHLMVPHAKCDNAIADPTHVRFFNKKTISFFCKKIMNIRPFRPLCVSQDNATIYADLTPVKNDQSPISEKDLSYFFE